MPEMPRPSTTADSASEYEPPPKASHNANAEAAIATAALATTRGAESTICAQARRVSMPI